jgi:hypothetical protein
MTDKTDKNTDPLTDTPGAYPVGTGVGAAIGTAIGAAAGALGGPVTMAAGAAVGGAIAGGLAGGLVGTSAGHKIDPTVENTYWSIAYASAPYVESGSLYVTYQPAYKYGWESYARHPGKRFDEVETDLARGWENARGSCSLSWNQAKEAARDAWRHVERAISGDTDNDRR